MNEYHNEGQTTIGVGYKTEKTVRARENVKGEYGEQRQMV